MSANKKESNVDTKTKSKFFYEDDGLSHSIGS